MITWWIGIISLWEMDQKYWYLLFLIFGISVIYSMVRSFIRWIVQRRSFMLLSYLFISFFIFTIYFGLSLLNGGLNQGFFYSFPLIMQSLAFFGCLLIIGATIRRWLNK